MFALDVSMFALDEVCVCPLRGVSLTWQRDLE